MARISSVGGIQSEIARRLNEISADHADKYLDWINLAQEDMTAEFPRAPWLETSAVLAMASGANKWQLSSIDSNLRQIYDVRISAHDAKPAFVPQETFNAMDPKPSDTGVPSIYSVYNDEIYFYPVPTDTYGAQIDYQSDIVTVSAASAVPGIPTQFLEGVILYSWAQGLYVREDYQQAQMIEQKYQRYLAKMKRDLKQRVLEARKMISIREIQAANKVYNDEITQMFFGGK